MITIKCNGQIKTVYAETVASLLKELGLEEGTVAVALNRAFVPFSSYSLTSLTEHDEIEIVAPMQGG